MPDNLAGESPIASLTATAVFDAFDQPVSVFDETGTYLYINAAGSALLGMAADALLGRHYLEVFPELEEHPFHLAFRRVAAREQARERLVFHYASLGIWASQHIYWVDGVIGVVWENITARKAVESQLDAALIRAADSERLFRSMIEGMPQLAWTARADGYVDYYNPRWYDFTGTEPHQMEGWGWQSVHDPAYLPEVMERWPHSIATGEPFEMEFPLRRRDGVYRWFLTRVAPVRDELGTVARWVGINTDIEDQKRALQELNDTLESMGDAFFLLDAEWRIRRVNRRHEEVSRTSRAETLGRVFWDVFPETRNPESNYWLEYNRCMRERAPVHFVEYYAPLEVWTEVDAFPSRDGGIAVFFRDVSVRKRSEGALLRERAVLEAVFREAPVGLALFDDQLRFLRVNSVLAEINGLPVADHIGRPVLDVLPGLPAEMLDQCREVLRTGTTMVGAEVVGTTPKAPDTLRIWRTSFFPVRVDQQTIGLGNIVEEVTEERRLAEERQRALSSLELLAETSTVLSSSLDYRASLQGVARLLVPNIADMCSIYVLATDGAVEQVASLHGDAEDAEGWRLIEGAGRLDAELAFGYSKVERSGETELMRNVGDEHYARVARNPAELELIRRLRPTSWIVVPLKAQQVTIGAIAVATKHGRSYSERDVSIVEDIGKRASLAIENARLYQRATTALEGERQARDKAEHATRLKDEFLATLSHELRTPLSAILGWARMLQSGALGEEKKPKAHDAIVRNAVAQNQLIEDMLDVSRIITGKLRLNVDFIDVHGIVEAALEGISPGAQAKGVRLQSVLDSAAGLVSGDAGRIQQVVWNLLSNAVKFTPRGGRVHVTLRQAGSSVEVSVADTGVGIVPDFLPYVFDRFRQQDGAITRRAGGLGLGLAIAKNLVELHGGTLEARSAGENQGAAFIMRIPVAPVRSAPASQRPAPSSTKAGALQVRCPAQLIGLRVLVVDDEPDARELIRTIVEHCGAIVATEATAAGALGALASFKPDVIVSDIGMPDEDGYTLVRKLRARPREDGGSTPAVALTAYARAEDRTRALQEGFQSHAAKPIDPEELLIVIATLAGRSA